VTRPKIEDFWKGLDREAKADMPPGTSEQAAQALWAGIDGKRLAAHRNVVLAVNTIRAPWLALRPVVEAFRRKYSADAQQVGFKEIWVVGASEAFTQRLDVVPNA
jgi:hypothetical protein